MSYQGPGTYRHYKGGVYQALGLALQEDTVNKLHGPEPLVKEKTFAIYRPLTPGSLLEEREEDFWGREIGDFNDSVLETRGTVGVLTPRFTLVHGSPAPVLDRELGTEGERKAYLDGFSDAVVAMYTPPPG